MSFDLHNCIIRKVCKDDYEEYLVMINEFRKTMFTEEQFIQTLYYMQSFSEVWIIEYQHDIIATGTIIFEKKLIFDNCTFAHIEDICVKEQYRTLGLGKVIVKYLMQLAKEKNCYKVTLVCSEDNSHFYCKCGLEKRGIQMSQLISNY